MSMISTNFPYDLAGKLKYFSGGYFRELERNRKGRSDFMSAIFGEKLTFPQEKGQEVKLVVYGDEFYAQYETEDGYSVVYDKELGLFCYAFLKEGAFFSSKIPLNKSPPHDLEKHLQEAGDVRLAKADQSAKRKGW
jgi:hypothetical protein